MCEIEIVKLPLIGFASPEHRKSCQVHISHNQGADPARAQCDNSEVGDDPGHNAPAIGQPHRHRPLD